MPTSLRRLLVAMAVALLVSGGWAGDTSAQKVKKVAKSSISAKQRAVKKAKQQRAMRPKRPRRSTPAAGKKSAAFKKLFEKSAKPTNKLNKTTTKDAKTPADAKTISMSKAQPATRVNTSKAKNTKPATKSKTSSQAKTPKSTPVSKAKPAVRRTKAPKVVVGVAKSLVANAKKSVKLAKSVRKTKPVVDETSGSDKADGDKTATERIIPERRTPIHQELQNPNFFGEDKDPAGTGTPTTAATWKGSEAALDSLHQVGPKFFRGDIGRVHAARHVNRHRRNDGDFRYAYGRESFRKFSKADAILNKIKRGKLADKLSVELVAKVNKTAFQNGGDGVLVTIGKALRTLFMPGAHNKPGELRNYQSYYFESGGLTETEISNLKTHGARYIRLPWTRNGKRPGWIVYAKSKDVRPKLDSLIAKTKAGLRDPNSDLIKLAATFVQKFIALHPFPDGNGRTARLVMDRILAERGLLPPILANTSDDIGMTADGFAAEVTKGIHRTANFLDVRPGYGESAHATVGEGRQHSAHGFMEKMMSQHGHTIAGVASQKKLTIDGMSYGLAADGFVYDVAGRPYLADKKGNLRPLSQMTHYIMTRRIAMRKNAPDVLQKVTARTRAAFAKLIAKGRQGDPRSFVISDISAIKSDASLSVDLTGHDKKLVLDVLDPSKTPSEKLFGDPNTKSPLTSVMSRYQQADLELWSVKRALAKEGDTKNVAKVEKHRDTLFARARAELRNRVKKDLSDPDSNPLGATSEFERIQYKYSALRYDSRKAFVKAHGDDNAIIFRGENFSKWLGVHIDAVPFRAGLKKVGAMRAKRLGAGNLYDVLRSVEGDTVGRGVQSFTTDLALLARPGGFADKHKALPVNMKAMPKIVQKMIDFRLKDGEMIEVTNDTGIVKALFRRSAVTRKGSLTVSGIDDSQLNEIISKSAPDKADAIKQRVTEARTKFANRSFFSRMASWFRGGDRTQVKIDDLVSEQTVVSLQDGIARSRNLITIRRTGTELKITAHRRAQVFNVRKTDMLPGIDAVGGGFDSEQEVHVIATVLPNRILETFSQKELAVELLTPSKIAEIEKTKKSTPQATKASFGSTLNQAQLAAAPTVKPLPQTSAPVVKPLSPAATNAFAVKWPNTVTQGP